MVEPQSDLERNPAEDVPALRRQLAEADRTIRALTKGQVDAVVGAAGGDALLLQRAQAALRESEARYRWLAAELAEAQQIAHVGSWQWDVLADRVTCSDELLRLLGQAPGRRPVPWAEFLANIHPDDRLAVHRQITSVVQSPQPFSLDYRLQRADGSLCYLHGRGAVKLDEAGRVVRVLGTCHDVTPWVIAQAEIRALNAQLAARVQRRSSQFRSAQARLERSHAQLRRLTSHLLAAREAEQTHLAREIHDGLGQALTALKLDLAWLRRHLDLDRESLHHKVEAMSGLIDSTVQRVRQLTEELRPGLLDHLGLLPALEWQLQDFATRAQLDYGFHTSLENVDLEPHAATAVFRVFQEALSNIGRHAQASRIDVRLAVAGGYLLLQVHDDGRGITAPEISQSRSLGLLGMRERVRRLRGELKISGVPGLGTTLTAWVPLHPAGAAAS
jgi:signal transduction histidine kinase